MGSPFRNLRIGEKIGLSFALAGGLFLMALWTYDATLRAALTTYEHLQDVYAAKRTHTFDIERFLLAARNTEKDFLLTKQERNLGKAATAVASMLAEVERLKRIDAEGEATATKIAALVVTYHARLESIAEAWRVRGLDHDSGLQGRFREAVHELERLAEHFEVDTLYVQLLQIRRAEKDLGLRREPLYREQVHAHVKRFEERVIRSGLETGVKRRLREITDAYLRSFDVYAKTVLANGPTGGGKGPFREAAHQIEDLLNTHLVPDLGRSILQLRRREKDYLLRHDRRYVDMTRAELKSIRAKIGAASISTENKRQLETLLANYERDFVSLVEQDRAIDRLGEEMQAAVAQVTPAVQSSMAEADRNLAQATDRVQSASRATVLRMRVIALVALLVGGLCALLISQNMTRAIYRINDALARLAHGDPTDRIPTTGDRNELEVMAGAVNTMMDHMERLIAWSMASMREDETHLRVVVDAVASGVVVIDEAGVVLAFSPAAEEIFGRPASEVLGQTADLLLPTLLPTPQAAAQLATTPQETLGQGLDGQPIPLWVSIDEVQVADRRLYCLVLLDIAQRKEAERQLRTARDAKSELQVIMNHEIRTIMARIVTEAESLAERRSGSRAGVDSIKKLAESLIDVVDVTLGFSRFDTEPPTAGATFDPAPILADLVAFFAEYAQKKGIRLESRIAPELPARLDGEAGNLRHVLVNLLSNAVKFTEQGQVSLDVDVSGDRLRITVTDTGIGIDKERMAALFGPSSSAAPAGTRKYRRATQGLSVTRTLLARMHGTIETRSEPGKGSTFVVELPVTLRSDTDG